jgi:phosphoglycolate phosphatase-like HAD superfamily hydrolase
MELLQSKNLLDRILDDFDACGIVGERTGKLVGYLAATSRLLSKPLGVIIQSSSAAGKSSLMNAILGFMPPEHQFACSAMTGQSLYYAANVDLRHKILSVAEEAGVRDASYALKLLQSEGHLAIVTTGKERGSGRTAVERHEVTGPVALMLTTSDSDVDPELMNRCFVGACQLLQEPRIVEKVQ